jgi:cytochrome c-type biogenesis protein CcmH/NrfG
VGKTLAASKQPAVSVPMKPPVTQEAKVEPKPEVKPEVKAPPVPEKTAEAVAVPAPTASASASAEVAKAEPVPSADPKAGEDPKKVEPSGGDAKALTKEAESFLNRGNRKEAMAKAREAIAADPSQALPYLLLGSALQDSGKWKDGIDAYSDCVRTATKGPVGDCRQMGGHK